LSLKGIAKEAQEQAQLVFQNGLELLQQNKLEEADRLFLQAHQMNPNNIDALNFLGIRLYQKQDHKNALTFLNKANHLAPNSANTLNNLGLVHNAIFQFQDALYFFDLAIASNPNIPEIHNNLGNALKGLQKNTEASHAYGNAIALRPNYAEAMNNQGVILLEDGLLEKARALFERAINANPNLAPAFNNLGNTFTQLKHYEDAFRCFERALQLVPGYLDALLNFGNCLKKTKRYESAIACYQQALQINSDDCNTFQLIADAHYEMGNSIEAKAYYAKSLAVNPHNMQAQFALAIAQIPKVFKDEDEIPESRRSFEKKVELLQIKSCEEKHFLNDSKIFSYHPFYIAYQEENNASLLNSFGVICTHRAKAIQAKLNSAQKAPKSSDKIRIGIVSHYFCDHPVWHAITKGWVNHLNSNLFEIQIFNTNGIEDRETEFAKANSSSYTNCGSSLEVAAQIIIDRNLDAVLFPEVGMDTTSKGLACLRLAPLQAVSWGHPETTGLPTIDCFLSAALLEPNEANSHYSEKLIQLPNLGTYFEPQAAQAQGFSLSDLGIDKNLPILLCAGSPSKYTPTHDHVLAEIAKKLGKCQFVFFNFDENLSAILIGRLRQSFVNAKLNPDDFIRFIPFLTVEEFSFLMQESALYLDTIGFSGFNTAMQAINCDLPIITIEGKFMRGRLASGLLRKLGLSRLICETRSSYINLVVELIQNKSLLKSVKEDIHKSKMVLFCDLEPIRSLESFLIKNLNELSFPTHE